MVINKIYFFIAGFFICSMASHSLASHLNDMSEHGDKRRRIVYESTPDTVLSLSQTASSDFAQQRRVLNAMAIQRLLGNAPEEAISSQENTQISQAGLKRSRSLLERSNAQNGTPSRHVPEDASLSSPEQSGLPQENSRRILKEKWNAMEINNGIPGQMYSNEGNSFYHLGKQALDNAEKIIYYNKSAQLYQVAFSENPNLPAVAYCNAALSSFNLSKIVQDSGERFEHSKRAVHYFQKALDIDPNLPCQVYEDTGTSLFNLAQLAQDIRTKRGSSGKGSFFLYESQR